MSWSARRFCAIVGAGPGLGKSLARAFARDGYEVGVLSRTEKGSAEALAAAKAAGAGQARYFPADARVAESLKARLGEVATALGPISCLVYNPRPDLSFKDPLAFSAEELRSALDLEVVGAHAAAQAVIPAMVAAGGGTFIVSSATAALRGSSTRTSYSTAKFALRGWSQCLAKAYARKGVHVVHVRLDCGMDVPLVRQMMGEKFNAENFANPDDVAEAYVAVAKQPKSAWSNEIELRPYTEDWTY